MNFHRTAITIAVFAILTPYFVGAQVIPPDDEIHKILAERVGENEKDIGIVVGVIDPQRQSGSDRPSGSDRQSGPDRRIISYGHQTAGDTRPLNGDTVFEIASVTKVFTALLLADMVDKKEVALSDPAAKYLPGVKLPERNGRLITLVDLATHTSGLPFMPADAPPFNDPTAAKYSTDDLKRFLAGYQLTRDIGSDWDYSNIGYWVLSEALAARAGKDARPARTASPARTIKDLIRQRVLVPLKMTDTDFELSPKMKSNLAPGHDSALQPAPAASTIPIYSIMPAIGLLYSTTNDLLTFLSECMGYEPSPLAPAMNVALSNRRPVQPGNEQALGWNVYGRDDDQVIFRDGSCFGYASAMAYDPGWRR
jgi:serine-type D-Ala-D-Ala carboxypeptidase/endopeptidase